MNTIAALMQHLEKIQKRIRDLDVAIRMHMVEIETLNLERGDLERVERDIKERLEDHRRSQALYSEEPPITMRGK